MAYEYLIPIGLGVGLAAATGFRIFIPLLIAGLAMRAGYAPMGESFAWAATTPALVMFGVAAVLEIAAYYIPGVDNLLDALATPVATVAGIGVSAAMMTDLPPMLQWTLAIIAGGGAASLTQSVTTLLRGSSTAFTGGLGNTALATAELIGATGLALLALAIPVIALLAVIALAVFAFRMIRKRRSA
jgi:hypothetical protein